MSETPKERIMSTLLMLSREELMEINETINKLLDANIDATDKVKEYFRYMKNNGQVIQAIKEYHDKTGCGLKEAKDYIDSL